MELRAFILSLPKEQREQFAARCETSIKHIYNVMCGNKSCSAQLAVAIERESDALVRVADLRPDFASILARSGYVRIERKAA